MQSVRVEPRACVTRTRLRLPLDDRLLVWDGHDFYSHHRRLDFDHAVIAQIGLTTNASRYSYDFVAVDAAGERYRGDSRKKENHFSYGRQVLAPGDGTVAGVVSDVSEQDDVSIEAMRMFST